MLFHLKTTNSISVKQLLYIGLICFLVIGIYGCSSSEKTKKTTTDSTNTKATSTSVNNNSNSSTTGSADIDWSSIKDEMSAPNKMRHTLLEEFALEEPSNENDNYLVNRRGYRVQIDFTRDVNTADSVKNSFNYRIRQLPNITYKAEAYVIYRPPYYRIRVGDFKDRLVALEYTKLLKRYYPASWVVADDINISLVPKKGGVIKERGFGTNPPDSSNYRQN